MRIRVADTAVLGYLCDHLSLQGYMAVDVCEGHAEVLMPAPQRSRSRDEAIFEIGAWRTKHGSVEVSVNPEQWRLQDSPSDSASNRLRTGV